jgi:DNA-binding LacI/PurR family transcriptional regulator
MATIRDRKDSKVQVVSQKLRELAIRKGPEAKLPTTRELCKALDTSSATLITALDELEMQNVVYRKDRSGIYVSHRLNEKTFALALGSRTFNNSRKSPFWDALWRLFIEEAQRRSSERRESLTIHIVPTESKSEFPVDDQLARLIDSGLIDGVFGVGLDEPAFNWITEHGLPVVSFAGKGTWHVQEDHTRMIQLAVRRLADDGCRRIWFWKRGDASVEEVDPQYTREYDSGWYGAFANELTSLGIPIQPELMVDLSGTEDAKLSFTDQGKVIVDRLVADGTILRGDGILITDDVLALGCLRELQRHDLLKDLKVVSHANKSIPVLYAFEPYISRVEFDPMAIISQMFVIMDRLMSGEEVASKIWTILPEIR